tara:strand:+ start:417 stop:1151 length:735 start_codon:yes stop_codon:yes gene_type:complete
MTISYTKPSWMSWADQGGSFFGGKDVTKALQMGVSHADIQKAVKASDALAGTTGAYGGRADISSNLQSAYDSAKAGKLDSSLGASAYTGKADIELYKQGRGGMSGKVAQEVRDQANYNPNLALGGEMSNLAMTIGGFAASQDAADTAADDAAEAAAWRESEATKRANEATKRYNAMIAAQEAAREAAKREAMKVRTSSATAVTGRPLGIRRNQSPAYRSGVSSRGTSQFARTGKGSNVKTLNIA